MSDGPRINERFPIGESLSPPMVSNPVYECAEAVNVTGFVPGATVRVFANSAELLAEDAPAFGFGRFTLSRPLKSGEAVTATQTVGAVTSGQSPQPAVVQPLDGDAVRNQKPDVGDDLYECGIVVPVGNLVPSTRLHVIEDTVEIGDWAVAGTWEASFTSPLHADAQVTARALACEGTGHEVDGPWSDPVTVKHAPVPTPPPGVDATSLIIGNNVVTLTGLLVGAGQEVFDGGSSICSGWYANGGANVFPVSPPVHAGSSISARQQLCGNVSVTSQPVAPAGELRPPVVLGPICDGSRFVVVRATIVNAIVVVFRNGSVVGYGGAAPGDVVLALGGNVVLRAGDVVTAIQYMGPTISSMSNSVTVVDHLTEPAIEVLGGEPFFDAKGGETPIDGPVFPRGRGGVVIHVQACCEREVRATILDPDGKRLAKLELIELYPGFFSATWGWTAGDTVRPTDQIPIGRYAVLVESDCSERAGRAPFSVIFDPDAVGAPRRFSFESTAVWFGTNDNSISGLHYYLHPSDARVFNLALQAASGATDPYDAAISIARAEENLFAYSLDYHSQDVVDLIVNYTEAQCADDACCLTALLRSVGIPAHPVTADAALETGAANWTFDTWVEFLSAHAGSTEWRCFHPHEYPGMAPESRSTFGLHGVANKAFNDVIVMANEQWVAGQLDDGSNDVTYGRNSCREPEEHLTAAVWIDELCERGYWSSSHWDCAGVHTSGLTATEDYRFDVNESRFGGRVAGVIEVSNFADHRSFGTVTIELVTSRVEAKRFAEQSWGEATTSVVLDPEGTGSVPFAFDLPRSLPPGVDLYLRARADQRTIALHRVRVPVELGVDVDLPSSCRTGDELTIRVTVRNRSAETADAVELDLDVPFALRVNERAVARLGALEPGAERTVELSAVAIAPLESGSVHLGLASANAGSVLVRRHITIAASEPEIRAHPGVRRE